MNERLFEAAKSGDLAELKRCFSLGCELDHPNTSGNTLLHWTALLGDVDATAWLVSHKVNVNAQNHNGNTPLHWAAEKGWIDILAVLIKAGADVTLQNRLGNTALHRAAGFASRDAARFLVAHGADPKKENHNHETPFLVARARGHEFTMNFLRMTPRLPQTPEIAIWRR